jgi:hypothetical protein
MASPVPAPSELVGAEAGAIAAGEAELDAVAAVTPTDESAGLGDESALAGTDSLGVAGDGGERDGVGDVRLPEGFGVTAGADEVALVAIGWIET